MGDKEFGAGGSFKVDSCIRFWNVSKMHPQCVTQCFHKMIQWAKARELSCYYLARNTLVYKHVFDSHKKALAFQEAGGHAYFYASAAPFAGMTPSMPRIWP